MEISSEEMAEIMNMIWTVIVIVMISIIPAIYIKQEVDTSKADALAFSARMLYSRSGITHFDEETGRVYTSVVDVSRVDSASIMHGANYREDFLSARITYGSKQAYYDENLFKLWEPLSGFSGKGGTVLVTNNFAIVDKETKNLERVRIEVATRK